MGTSKGPSRREALMPARHPSTPFAGLRFYAERVRRPWHPLCWFCGFALREAGEGGILRKTAI